MRGRRTLLDVGFGFCRCGAKASPPLLPPILLASYRRERDRQGILIRDCYYPLSMTLGEANP